MFFNVPSINFVVANIVSLCFTKVWGIVSRRTMDNSIQQATKLLQRLNEAERRARLLKLEIKDIREQIATLTQSTNAVLAANQGNTSSVAIASTSGISRTLTNCSTKRSKDNTDHPVNNMEIKRPRHDLNIEDGFVVVFTDGACENNGKPNAKAGIGVWFGENHPLNISKPVVGRATNNTAEIQAPCEALKVIKGLGYRKAKIITDSRFTIDCMTKWIQNWKRNNWKLSNGGPVKNKEDLVVLDRIINEFLEVKWEHIAGHSGHKGNEEADKLARAGAVYYRP